MTATIEFDSGVTPEDISDKDLVELIAHCGSYTAAGSEFGWLRDKFTRHVAGRGLKAKADQALIDAKEPKEETVEEVVLEIDDPHKIRLDQYVAENRALKRDNDKYAKILASQERFFDRIVEETRIPVNIPDLSIKEQDGDLPVRSIVCPIYDQQFGQFVRPTDTPTNVGDFSVSIFDYRLQRYVDAVTNSIRDYAASHKIDELIIPLGGDHVEGDDIFSGQAWQLEIDPPRQVWELTLKMTEALRTIICFAKEQIGVERIGIYGVTGNHGKVGGKKKGATPGTYNWDWLFLMLLKDRLREEPIDQFEIESGGSVLFSSADHIFLAIHGDEIKGWGGIPFYGLTRYDGRAMRLHRVMYDYLLMGHHHQPATIPNGSGEHIISGDWVGANNLSRYITAASRPQQRILYVAKKYGIVETSNIYFTTAEEAGEEPTVHEL